jgi:hypothetical protein
MYVYIIEFAQPGGSDQYENGFQHLEISTQKEFNDLCSNTDLVKQLYFEGKYGDEGYLKWEDKIVLKLKRTPLYFESLAEDNSVITCL